MMTVQHKNKTLATFLALVSGGLGAHRFYLYGPKDGWAWVHLSALPVSLALLLTQIAQPRIFAAYPLAVSALAGFIAALAIGVTPDDKWDGRHNPDSGRQSQSGWPVVLLLVLTLGVGSTALFAAIARTVDLLYTGGSYG